MREHLSFELGDELYAIPIVRVREILGGAPRLTRIPSAPPFLKGLLSLRGAIIPVVDLREELGLPSLPYDKLTVVIIADVLGVNVGLVVDNAVDVVTIREANLAPLPPNLDVRVRAEFVSGLCEVGDRILILLDLDKLLSDERIGILRSASAA